MEPVTPPILQRRLKRFVRQPERLGNRRLTPKGLQAIAAIERYRFLPTSQLIRLIPGDHKNNHRHLQTLYHKGYINRFALPTLHGMPGEFVYYLDTLTSFHLLLQEGLINPTEADRQRKEELIRLNREKAYSELHKDPDQQGKLMFIQHELMVSRFHFMLEQACRKFSGKVFLEQWKQGSELYGRVSVPTVKLDRQTGDLVELNATEFLPHRPDAFFTLYFPDNPPESQRSHFMYEADRGSENTTRYKLKLRSHFHFLVVQKLQRQVPYNVAGIRAVLTESTSMQWAHNLREAARHPIVAKNPSPLFWFTTSELFTKPVTVGSSRTVPLYLEQPEVVFKRIWANPTEEKFFNLAD